MSSIKVVDVNEEAKQEQPKEEMIEEAKEEVKEEVVNETVNEVIQEKATETVKQEQEPLKNNSKSERLRDKKITCPKCSKSMLLRSYRYKHELNCQGKLEDRQITPKAKPQPKPQPIIEEEREVIEPKPTLKKQVSNQVFKPTNPLNDITNHYKLLVTGCACKPPTRAS